MNYELAKQLKEAGFRIIEHLDKAPENTDRGFYGLPSDKVYAPTLSELIEACNPNQTFKIYQEKAGNCWVAEITRIIAMDEINKKLIIKTFKAECCCNINEPTVPEEAVAKLWLELHKI